MLTSGASLLKTQQPNLYRDLLSDTSPQVWDEIINNDLNRTYPDNIYFTSSPDGKLGSLYNVLRATASHNPTIGYCQVTISLKILKKSQSLTRSCNFRGSTTSQDSCCLSPKMKNSRSGC